MVRAAIFAYAESYPGGVHRAHSCTYGATVLSNKIASALRMQNLHVCVHRKQMR